MDIDSVTLGSAVCIFVGFHCFLSFAVLFSSSKDVWTFFRRIGTHIWEFGAELSPEKQFSGTLASCGVWCCTEVHEMVMYDQIWIFSSNGRGVEHLFDVFHECLYQACCFRVLCAEVGAVRHTY